MKNISKSEFSIFFDNIEDIYILDDSESKIIWENFIDKQAKSYYKLNDDNWIIKSNFIVIGEWIDQFNLGEFQKIENTLLQSFNWELEDIINFCINSKTIIRTNWINFCKNWDNFLSVYDDCPIIINETNLVNSLLFTPLGEIRKINKR